MRALLAALLLGLLGLPGLSGCAVAGPRPAQPALPLSPPPSVPAMAAPSSAAPLAMQPDAAFRTVQLALAGHPGDAGPAFASALAAWQADGDCGHPLQARYFRDRFSAAAAATATAAASASNPAAEAAAASAGAAATDACSPRVPFLVNTLREGRQPVWVDPGDVRAIHLLFAGNGKGAASRFGHVALRLVVCPDRNASDAACDANLRAHVVVGFVAHVDAFEISVLKGLSGHYRARLAAGRFLDAYQEYAIGEFRDLFSVPLRLGKGRREAMVRELAQIHWQYDGDYTFFGRNCASLLQRALRALWPEAAGHAALATTRVRPDRLFAALRDSDLVEGGRLADLRQAEREGFYFPATRPYYEQAAALLGTTLQAAPFRDVDTYLASAPPLRRAVFLQADNRARLQADPRLAEAGLLMEELALLRAERRFGARLAQLLDRYDIGRRAPDLRAQLAPREREVLDGCVLAPLWAALDPPPARDGLPAVADMPAAVGTGLRASCLAGDAPTQLQAVLRHISGGDAPPWESVMAAAREWGGSMRTVLLLREMLPAS